MEECAEVTQRASKALRFGLQEIEPGQEFTNAERIVYEFNDLIAAMELLIEDGAISDIDIYNRIAIVAKKEKVKKYLAYSIEQGTVNDEMASFKKDMEQQIGFLKKYDADFCAIRWDTDKTFVERGQAREESNKVTFAMRILETLLKKNKINYMKFLIEIECEDRKEFQKHLDAISKKIKEEKMMRTLDTIMITPENPEDDVFEFSDNNCYGTHTVTVTYD